MLTTLFSKKGGGEAAEMRKPLVRKPNMRAEKEQASLERLRELANIRRVPFDERGSRSVKHFISVITVQSPSCSGSPSMMGAQGLKTLTSVTLTLILKELVPLPLT